MLRSLKNKTIVKRILWALVLLMLPTFLLWDTGSKRGQENRSICVGIIDSDKISLDELLRNIKGIRSQLTLNYFNQSKALDSFRDNKPFLARLGWERLVLLREAKTYSIKIPDREVITYIRTHPAFVRNGAFDQGLYSYILKHTLGLGPRDFEEIVRENLRIEKLKDIISKDLEVSEEDILKEYRRDNGKIKISYLLIPREDFLDKVNIDDAAVKNYYKNHKSEFMLPQPKSGEGSAIPDFEEVKSDIRAYLAGNEAKRMMYEEAGEVYKKILEMMEKENTSFESAAAARGLKTVESPMFSKSASMEEVGGAGYIIGVALALTKPDQISEPIETKSGIVIFRVLKIEDIDGEEFKKEKSLYSKKVLEDKKMRRLDERFRTISQRTRLMIDFGNIEKYTAPIGSG